MAAEACPQQPGKEAHSVFKKNTFSAFLLKKTLAPSTWAQPTLLCRLLTKGGLDLVLTATKSAKTSLEGAQEGRAYDFEIPPHCLRKNTQGPKTGVFGDWEIRIIHQLVFAPTSKAWQMLPRYECRSYEDINQLSAGAFTDLIGRAVRDSKSSPQSTVPKACVMLANDGLTLDVELLGDHSQAVIKAGAVVAIKGAKVTEYNGDRVISTTFLTVLDINPGPNLTLTTPATLEEGTSTKRAMRVKSSELISSRTVKDHINNMKDDLSRLPSEQIAAKRYKMCFSIKASFAPFTHTVFEGSPFYGPAANPQMRLQTTLMDSDGVLRNVVFWAPVIETITETSIDALAEAWSRCEATEEQTKFMEMLNSTSARQFVFSCSLRPWRSTSSEGTSNTPAGGEVSNGVGIQINANSAREDSDGE